jgi:hypothetical protein
MEALRRCRRRIWPWVVAGLGVLCCMKEKRRQMRERCKRAEDRQEEILKTLQEIREGLKNKDAK